MHSESPTPTTRRACGALRRFAREQVLRAEPSSIDIAALTPTAQRVGLVICLHNGTLYYQTSHHSHMYHGEVDRVFGALQVAFQWLRRTDWRGTKCFQHSLRDDQSHDILDGVDRGHDTLGLPAMLWHSCVGTAGSRAAACGAPSPSNAFLWPEYDYEGSLTQHQPPTRVFRERVRKRSPAWAARQEMMPYRSGTGMRISSAPVRKGLLACSSRLANARSVAEGTHLDADLRHFYRSIADIGTIDWQVCRCWHAHTHVHVHARAYEQHARVLCDSGGRTT